MAAGRKILKRFNNVFLMSGTWPQILVCGLIILLSSCTPSRQYLLRHQKKYDIEKSEIKVLLFNTDKSVELTSESGIRLEDKKRNRIVSIQGNKKVIINPHSIHNELLLEAANNILSVNGKQYRGKIVIRKSLNGISIINKLSINEYLYSVVPSEMPASWPSEALKAQAVAARTFAYHHLLKDQSAIYDLDSTTKFQVYSGISTEQETTSRAVDQTTGRICVYENKPIVSYFHSTCGGRIIDDKYVWSGEDLPYLQSFTCPFCKHSPKFNWDDHISMNEISDVIKKKYKTVNRINAITFKKHQGRIVEIHMKHESGVLKISGNDFRMLLSPSRIKSLYFSARQTPSGLKISGYGWGHGVGLCQYGAKGMAERNYKYNEILNYYFKNTHLITIDSKQMLHNHKIAIK